MQVFCLSLSFFLSTLEKGYSQQQILRAQGLKEAKILEAEGIAIALEKIGQATQTESGQRALQFLFGRFRFVFVWLFSSSSSLFAVSTSSTCQLLDPSPTARFS